MLDWLTLLVAVVAAAGAVIGPIVAYRSATRALRREDEQARRDNRQERIDVAVQYALSDNPVIAEMGVKQLLHLLQAGELTDEQKVAVVNAMEASLEIAASAVGSSTAAGADGRPEARSLDAGGSEVRWVANDAGEERGSRQ